MPRPSYDAPPQMQIDPNGTYVAVMETSHGTITIELFAADAPNTVNSFTFLARDGFYDGLTFHRIIPGFVIQGGDPQGTGAGGPGYEFEDELDNDLGYQAGTLAMANAGPHTNGSQFFIVSGAEGERLPKNYTIFGRVSDGMDAVKAIERVSTDVSDRPKEPVVIQSVRIEEPAS
ncbi:MAG TPA: peptidylprolyl isomerase [Actinomycetota bacterium]|jgi:peptidylprolyl isomerase/peptidyl-prolyl cis-trans isomerase B (cyclophilin B)